MSVFNQGKPSRMRSVWGHNSGTTTEVVYTCPANCVAELTFVHIVNGGGSTNSIDVEWYVAADDYTSHFLAGKSLGAGDNTTFVDIDLVSRPGDKIQVTPASAGHIDTILTVTETFVPVG
eukprot:GHVR01046744.1.p1 GENE.GHVR01046744.1~~GHVR01046744.1.p1  ORF type:complete len:120 (+),score=23.84 GHVR01046744.1:201-560(+)